MTEDGENYTPKVFISYAHEGDLREQVRGLADWLTENGVEVITDHPYVNRPPVEGWRAWMQHNLEKVDTVLIVCTERYKKLFEKEEIPADGGNGATWESAIITDALYQSHMRNRRFFPILTDDGDRVNVPVVLRDWDNGHRFPSGNSRILSLIRDEVVIPKPKKAFERLLPSELSGCDDPRLQPREGEVIGRKTEVAEVVDFLSAGTGSATICGHVTGSGGIGKTEVCKAALKDWLASGEATRTFYIQIDDYADASRLLSQLGEAVGLSSDALSQIRNISQLRPHLPAGLYYLDNLEHAAESAGGIRLLRELIQTPGLRILASSRVALEQVFGSNTITIDRLETDKACTLFLKIWNGVEAPDQGELYRFVDEELGGHALCITLVARLGKAYSWRRLTEEWQRQGILLAETRNPEDRLDSLTISFRITQKLLAQEEGTLDLWQFAALFPKGLSEDMLDQWERISGFTKPRLMLTEHHLLRLENHQFIMLPPVARYALEHATPTENGFCWARAKRHAYRYFIDLSRAAGEVESSPAVTESRSTSATLLPAIGRLLAADASSTMPAIDVIRQLHNQLQNTYLFNVSASSAVLTLIHDLLSDALSLKILGDLERQLGQPDLARNLYEQATELFKKERDDLGIANTLKSLGDLERRLGQPDLARTLYEQAIELFKKKRNDLGLANTLKGLGDLESRLGQPDLARTLYEQAIELYQKERADLGLANTLQSLGDLERRLGQLDLARDLYEQAIELFKKERDGLGLANTLKSLGDLETLLGQPDLARTLYEQAIELYKKERADLGLANTLISLGDLERRLGQPDLARTLYEQAIELYKKKRVDLGLAYALKSLGDLERRLGQPDLARALYEQAIELYKKERDELGLANVYQSQGDVLLSAEMPDLALPIYRKALTLYRAAEAPMGQAYTLAEIIRCRHRLGELDDMEGSARAALTQANASNLEPVRQYVLGALYEVCGEDENRLEALLGSLE